MKIEALPDDLIEELISKPTASVPVEGVFDNTVDTGRPTTDAVELTWCEFCKGNYIAEYHYGEEDVA